MAHSWLTTLEEDRAVPSDRNGALVLDFDHLPVGIVILEWSEGKPVISAANREAELLLGKTLSPGEPMLPLLAEAGARHPGSEMLRRPDVLAGYLGAGRARSSELMWVDGVNGDQCGLRLTMSRLPGPGSLRVMMVMEDVTDLAHLQQAHDAFAAAVSHELRTPVTAVRGIGELLRMQLGELSQEAVAEGLDRILAEAGALTGIVEGLLDLIRLKLGLFEVEFTPVDLAETARSMASVVPELEVEVDPLVDHILTDRRLLERALTHLLENAIRHGAPPYGLHVDARGGGVAVSVVDRGPGISVEERKRLFVPFMKGAARFGTGEGTGLGLALVRALVSAMGGEAIYEDLPGGGASVSIVFGREYA